MVRLERNDSGGPGDRIFYVKGKGKKETERMDRGKYQYCCMDRRKTISGRSGESIGDSSETAGDERISLYQIYEFLRLNIASNRSEPAAVIQTEGDYRSVLCMTVHGSKGLEFDTVIIPYTNSPFPDKARTELLVDPEKHKVGWNCEEEQNRHYKYEKMSNTWYEELKSIECQSAAQEECRILYVAMTRAIETLICIVPDSKGRPCWAKLIEEVGVDYE